MSRRVPRPPASGLSRPMADKLAEALQYGDELLGHNVDGTQRRLITDHALLMAQKAVLREPDHLKRIRILEGAKRHLVQEARRWKRMVKGAPSGHKLNADQTVAVATDVFWNEDMATCPRGAKVQLLEAGGVASYGVYNGRDPFWVGWAPVPKRRVR